MEIGDWIVITLIVIGIIAGSGYLQKQNPGAYSVLGNTWAKVSVGTYDWISGALGNLKASKPVANMTGGG